MDKRQSRIKITVLLMMLLLFSTGCSISIDTEAARRKLLDDSKEKVKQSINGIIQDMRGSLQNIGNSLFGEQYTISFDGNGADRDIPDPITYRKKIDEILNPIPLLNLGKKIPRTKPQRDGFDFEGWAVKKFPDNARLETETGKVYQPGDNIQFTGDLKLYAVWSNKYHSYEVVERNKGKIVTIECSKCGLQLPAEDEKPISFEDFKKYYYGNKNEEYIEKLHELYLTKDYGPLVVYFISQLRLSEENKETDYSQTYSTIDSALNACQDFSGNLEKIEKNGQAFVDKIHEFSTIDEERITDLFEKVGNGAECAGKVFTVFLIANDLYASFAKEENLTDQMSCFLSAVRHGLDLIPIPLVKSFYDYQLKVMQEGLKLAKKVEKREIENLAKLDLAADEFKNMPNLDIIFNHNSVILEQGLLSRNPDTDPLNNFPTSLSIVNTMYREGINVEDLSEKERVLLARYLEQQFNYELQVLAGITYKEYVDLLN